jgi:hypothetical protein
VTYAETMAGFSLANALSVGRHMDSAEQKEMMAVASDTFPMRIRAILLVHQPWYFTMFWSIVRPFLKAKMTKRLKLLGSDLTALHALVPPASLPAEFGGCAPEPRDWLLQAMRRQERETGSIGGWALPLSVEDPTGEVRRRKAATAAAEGGAGGPGEKAAAAPTTAGAAAADAAVGPGAGAAESASAAADPAVTV